MDRSPLEDHFHSSAWTARVGQQSPV